MVPIDSFEKCSGLRKGCLWVIVLTALLKYADISVGSARFW